MNPKWNPIVLMVLGAVLVIFAYVTSAWYSAAFSIIVLSVGGLTLASGVVLAYLHFFRDDATRAPRRY